MNKEVKFWFTTKTGKHIPVFEGETKEDAIKRIRKNPNPSKSNTSTQSQHKQAIKELSDSKYADGTYDIVTKKTESFPSGYQFTFCQIGDNYSDSEYQQKVNECLKLSSNKKTYAGKFGGTPEISFHCDSKEQAFKYAEANNQISIWDWAANQRALELEKKYGEDDPRTIAAWVRCEIKTGGTGRRK